jgi:hypothetical protein
MYVVGYESVNGLMFQCIASTKKHIKIKLSNKNKNHYSIIIIIIINGTAAQSRGLGLPYGFRDRYITMWVISLTINLVLVILIQPPETYSGEATTDI